MGLINVGIMTGMLALGVPVAIHMLRSRRYQRARLGTLRFLQQAVRETARWRRLRDLLLLLARLLAFALLTLLFARPYLRSSNESETDAMEAILLLDTSGSMAGVSLGVTNLELAKESAARVLAELPPSTKVTIGAFADRVWEVPNLEDAELATGGTTDYRRALQWARDRLTLSPNREKRVLLVTDMQNVGLPVIPFEDWPLDIGVDLIPAEPPGTWNSAITAVRVTSPYLGSEGIVEVDIKCFGEQPDREELEVALEFEGQGEALCQTVRCRSDRIDFRWTPKHAGIWRGTARIVSEDAYQRDNERCFAFEVRAPYRAVLVNGEPGKTAFQHETYYLAMALNVPVRDGVQSGFQAEQRLDIGDLSGCRVVALCNVASVPARDAERLRRYVTEGGGLIYFLGSQVGRESFAELARLGLFPAALSVRRAAVPRQIIDWDIRHPAMRAFNSREAGDLSRIIFRETFELKPDTGTSVLAELSSGGPAILAGTLGRGHIIVVANPCDRDWSNWPAERIFVPVVRELFSFLAQAEGPEMSVREISPGMSEKREPGVHDGPPVTVIAPAPQEVDVRVCSETAFRDALGVGAAPPDSLAAPGDGSVPPGRERRNELWRILAAALLGIIFIENILADRGH